MSRSLQTPEAEEFWSFCAREDFRLQRCCSCRAWRYPPRKYCPECGSGEAEWKPVSGKGSILSFAIFHHDFGAGLPLPYAIILVRLEEGPVMVGRLVESSLERLRIGLPVEVHWEREVSGRALPLFTLR